MMGFTRDESSDDEIAAEVAAYGPLADSVRRLVDASIRTTVDLDTARDTAARLNAIAEVLETDRIDGGYGVRFRGPHDGRAWGNAVVGLRNPIAPPLQIHWGEGQAWTETTLGAAYEGPPGLLHGGVSALLLDQLLGEACSAAGRPGMTGTLTMRYRQGVKLGQIRGEAEVTGTEGVKTYATGRLRTADGVCVEAEGVFILPRWARGETEPPERFE